MRLYFKTTVLTAMLFLNNFSISCSQDIGINPPIINENCDGLRVNSTVGIYSFMPEEQMHVYNISSNAKEFKCFINKKQVSEPDTLIIPPEEILELEIEFKNTINQTDKVIKFKTIGSEEEHEIDIYTGSFNVTEAQQINSREKSIKISESCLDSINIFFPYGGTVSSVTIYKDSLDTNFIKETSYAYEEGNNYIKFHKNEIGKYFVYFGTCHWDENYWLTLE